MFTNAEKKRFNSVRKAKEWAKAKGYKPFTRNGEPTPNPRVPPQTTFYSLIKRNTKAKNNNLYARYTLIKNNNNRNKKILQLAREKFLNSRSNNQKLKNFINFIEVINTNKKYANNKFEN